MTDSKQGRGVLSALALVRAAGRVYARRADKTAVALQLLHDQVRAASEAGASVTELSEASGLSRQAIYRHTRQRHGQWPVV